MKFPQLLTAFLMATVSLTLPTLLVAQDSPASTYQPGPWQPVARVDLNRPVEIRVLNQTQIPLDYDLTANIYSSARNLLPGETTTVKGFNLPIYLLIYRSADARSGPISLIYNVAVNDKNVVTVTVTQAGGSNSGHTTLNLNEQGAIYVY